MKEQSLWTRLALLVIILFLDQTKSVVAGEENPPQYGYDDLPETRFSCEGKLPGRYYADPETDCQMFHVCVKMSRRETQDFRFLCPNGTVFDQEHLVCADYYQVACNSGHSSAFGHIFEFLKLTAAGKDDSSLTFGKVPLADPEYLGRNTLGGEDFQVEEYNNNKLAASGNSLVNSQGQYKPKEIQFPTTTTRKTTTTTPRPTTTVRTTTAAPTTLAQNQQFPVDEQQQTVGGVQSTTTYQQNNLNFHRETDAPQSFPTTTRRPDYFQTTNFANNYNNNNNNFGFNEYSTTYAPSQTYQPTTTRRPSFFQQQTNNPTTTIANYNYQETSYFPSTFPTTTRRPAIFQSTFRTNLDALTTPSPVQSQATYQQQSSRFNEDFFKKIPTTEQSTTVRTQNLFFNGNPQPLIRHTTFSPLAPSTTFRNNFNNNGDYYSTTQDSQYFPQGRSINSQPSSQYQQQAFLKTDKPKQFATKATQEPETYSTTPVPVTYYEPAVKVTSQAGEYLQEQQQRFSETTLDPVTTTTSTTTTTTTARPRRGGRRRINPNRQRQQQQQQQQQQSGPKNFDPQFKYSRRVESSRFNERESFAVKQKTEEIFNAEASVYGGRPKTNIFYNEDKRQSKEQQPATTPNVETVNTQNRRPAVVASSFGGENFGRRIFLNSKHQQADAIERKPARTSSSSASDSEVISRPDGTRVVKRLRQKKTSTTSTTTTTEAFPNTDTTVVTEQPSSFAPTTLRPARVTVRTKTIIGGLVGGAGNFSENNNGKTGRRRVVIKTIRPKSSSTSASTEEPILITASVAEQERLRSSAAAEFQNREDRKQTFTTLQVEEIPPTTTYRPAPIVSNNNAKNITATVGGFKVTVISSKSSDQSSSSSSSSQQQLKKPTQPVKPTFPKLNKKLIGSNEKSSNNNSNDDQIGSTQSPDYDYSYYNTDDESQYVAEQNSQDRLFGKKARRRAAAAVETPV